MRFVKRLDSFKSVIVLLLGGSLAVQAIPIASKKSDVFLLQKHVSQQFIVYGTRRDLISLVMRRANDLAERWHRLFRLASLSSSKPIIIRLLKRQHPTPPHAHPFEIYLFLDDANRLKVQLDVFDLDGKDTSELDERIFHALTLRNAYIHASPALGRPYDQPPPWVIEAAIQDLFTAEEKETEFAQTDEIVLKREVQDLDLKSFLAEKPREMELAVRAIYRVKAYALLRSLLEQPQGEVGLRAFLSNPHAWRNGSSSLLNFFPELQRDATALTKVWIKNLMLPTAVQKKQPFRMKETAQQLNIILFILLPPGMKQSKNRIITGAETMPLIAAVPKYKQFLHSKVQDLLFLSVRAHPLYRALIDEYREIVEILLQFPSKDLTARIQAAEKMRWAINKYCMDIEDYMNGAERVSSMDGAFQSLLENDQRGRVRAWRPDAISLALDAAEAMSGCP